MQTINLRMNYPVLSEHSTKVEESLLRTLKISSRLLTLQPPEGCLVDRKIAAKWLSCDVHNINTDELVLTNSGHNACMVTLFAANLKGKYILVENLVYANF